MDESTLRRYGYWILFPRTQQVVLGAFILILAVAASVPFPFFSYAVAMNSNFLGFQYGLAVLILVPVILGMNARVLGTDKIRMLPGLDIAIGGLAIATALVTAVGAINVAYMFTGCTSPYAIQSLPQYVLGVSLEVLNASITSSAISRRLFFATDINWYQGCSDDLPVAIVLLIAYGALIVLDIVAAIMHFNLRRRTLAWEVEMRDHDDGSGSDTDR